MAIATINPATGVIEATFEADSEAEIERKIAESHAAYLAMRATDYAARGAWMVRAAEILEAEVEQAARILTIEMGKTIGQARSECSSPRRPCASTRTRRRSSSPVGSSTKPSE